MHTQHLEAVGRLAGGVAHDFNNLLSVINGYCEILVSKPAVRRAAARELAEIHQAGQQAATLVRQLLAFSRRQALDPRVLGLNRFVRENADILSKLLRPDKSLALDLGAKRDHVRVDLSQLQQVLLNLLLNARDALAAGGRVRIRTTNRLVRKSRRAKESEEIPPGRYVVLSVEDDGHGMDADTLAHLFEPFFTTKEHGQGTGLGLSLVFGVVQQSGGHIAVQSAKGVGATFSLYFPEVSAPTDPQPSLPAALPSTRGSETLLVVEEDPVVRKMVAGILTSDGYRVIDTGTPAQAARACSAQAEPVHLIILNYGSLGGPGEKLVKKLGSRWPELCVLTTGSGDPKSVQAVPAVRQATLAKPYALSSLLREVRSLLDGSYKRTS